MSKKNIPDATDPAVPQSAAAGCYISGVCRVCGCTERRPCFLTIVGEAMPCWWIDPRETLCSNFKCIALIPLDELILICTPDTSAAVRRMAASA